MSGPAATDKDGEMSGCGNGGYVEDVGHGHEEGVEDNLDALVLVDHAQRPDGAPNADGAGERRGDDALGQDREEGKHEHEEVELVPRVTDVR